MRRVNERGGEMFALIGGCDGGEATVQCGAVSRHRVEHRGVVMKNSSRYIGAAAVV